MTLVHGSMADKDVDGIIRALGRSQRAPELLCAPGNAGIAGDGAAVLARNAKPERPRRALLPGEGAQK